MIKIKGNVAYSFDAPTVNLDFDKIANIDSTKSGQIQIQLWNNQYSDGSGNCRLIAEFYLSPIEGNTYYYDISRCLQMKNDVKLPYLQVIAYEKYTDGWKWSDDLKFTKRVNNINRRNAFRITTVKNGIKTAARIAGAAGTVASVLFPPLAAVGTVVGAVGSLISSFFD